MVNACRRGAIAARIRLKVVGDSGRERTSRIEVRLDRGEETRPRRVALDLGRYTLFAEPDHLLVLDRYAPAIYASLPLGGEPTPESLGALPVLPLPQVQWALGPDEIDPSHALAPLVKNVSWTGIDAAPDAPQALLKGDSELGPVNVILDAATWRLISLRVSLGQGASPASIRIEAQAIDPGDPAAWAPSVAGRTSVGSIADLRPPPSDAVVGGRLPGLGLMSTDLAFHALRDELEPASDLAPPTLALLVLFHPGANGAMEDATAGIKAAIEAKHEIERKAVSDRVAAPRLVVHPVGMVELGEVSPRKITELAGAWREGFAEPVEPLWSSTGQAMLDRFAPGASCVCLIVTPTERLAAMLRLDARAGEPEALTQDIRDAIDGALAQFKLPELSGPEEKQE